MLVLRIFFLWSLVSLHVVGSAVLFRRFFPRESPWFGFIVPSLAVVLALNFTEYGVALTGLRWLLPLTSLLFVWLIASPSTNWRLLRFPAALFLGSFAFTLLVRSIKPDITSVRDGFFDVGLISDFCMGQSLPVESNWLPPNKLEHYYFLPHYAASILVRLFGLDVGTGFNLAGPLTSAFIYFCAAAIAWRLSQRKWWVAVLAPILIACAANGSTAYLWLTLKSLAPETTINLHYQLQDFQSQETLLKYLIPRDYPFDCSELFVPGWWTWSGSYHSVTVGQFLSFLFVWSLVEIFNRKKSNWPWICLGLSTLLMFACSTWGVPIIGLFLLGGVYECWRLRLTPRNPRFVVMVLAGATICLTPMLLSFLTTSAPGVGLTQPTEHTEWTEFLLQWWPIYLPWLALFFIWRKLHPAVRIICVLLPFAFLGVEFFNVGLRTDMTGKTWAYIFAIGWAVFIPTLAIQRSFFYHAIFGLVLISSAASFCFWSSNLWETARTDDIFHLEGLGPFRWDPKQARLFMVASQMHDQVIQPGKSIWSKSSNSLLAHLTGNRVYVACSSDCDTELHPNPWGVAVQRENEINSLYDGKMDNPLLYLRQHNITALVIWDGDNIAPEVVEKLKQQLGPCYRYDDFQMYNTPTGIFVYVPEAGELATPSQ